MLQETVWALSSVQRPLRQVRIINSIISNVSFISKLVCYLKVSLIYKLELNLKVSIKKVSIIKS